MDADSPLLASTRPPLNPQGLPRLPPGMERAHSMPLAGDHLPPNDKANGDRPVVHGGKGGSSVSTTIGLLVHSLADGISLGASAAVSASEKGSAVSLDIIVFIAIMVHKAPAAFGLCTVLMGDGWARNRIRLTLTAFAATAPIGAVLTYFFLQLISHLTGGGKDADALKWWTGMALLFSGGTFVSSTFL
jgi:zinc transporter 9